jgi:hypothetical protein
MTSVELVLCTVLPLIARSFYSLHTLSLLRQVCKYIYEETKNYTLVYRMVLKNTGWINKKNAMQAFVLSCKDLKRVGYIDCVTLSYYQKFVSGYPRGHLVPRRRLFEMALRKHGSVDAICKAHIKRVRRQTIMKAHRLFAKAVWILNANDVQAFFTTLGLTEANHNYVTITL